MLVSAKEIYKGKSKVDNDQTKLLICSIFENTPHSADAVVDADD